MSEKTFSLQSMVAEIASNRAKILDDFFQAYIASKDISVNQIQNLELVEERTDTGYKWYFRMKPFDSVRPGWKGPVPPSAKPGTGNQ